MKIKLIDYGYKHAPLRAHANDVGADVYALESFIVSPGQSRVIPLGFGIDLPVGFGAFVFPRSSQCKIGIDCKLAPVDPGYTGEMHALIYNGSYETYRVREGDRIGQLIILPVVIADFVNDMGERRDAGAFGSTGR